MKFKIMNILMGLQQPILQSEVDQGKEEEGEKKNAGDN